MLSYATVGDNGLVGSFGKKPLQKLLPLELHQANLTLKKLRLWPLPFKKLGHKGGLKSKRDTLEGEVYTPMRLKAKKFTAVVRVGASTHEIKEYNVQPKSEEGFFVSFSPKLLLIIFIISAIVNAG